MAEQRRGTRRRLSAAACRALVITLAALALSAAAMPSVRAASRAARTGNDTIRTSLTATMKALRAFQQAADASDGSRAPGSAGFRLSQRYLASQLRRAGYDVYTKPFHFWYTATLAATLTTEPGGQPQTIQAINFTPSTPVAGIAGPVAALPAARQDGCAASAFSGRSYRGDLVLIERGGCTFSRKQQLAARAGASAALIYNDQPGPLNGSLSNRHDGRIPTAALTQSQGLALRAILANWPVDMRLRLRQYIQWRLSSNLFAQTRWGSAASVFMMGAHLDSWPRSPGINSDATGSAIELQVALALARSSLRSAHMIRFSWFSADEWGQAGSLAYVQSLSARQLADITGFIDLEKLGSPNYIRGYLTSRAGGAPDSGRLAAALRAGLSDQGRLPVEGVSLANPGAPGDWVAFYEAGVPFGGLYSGGEGSKTPTEAAAFGGRVGVAYDPCHHLACDDLANINTTILGDNLRAAAYALGVLMKLSPSQTAGPAVRRPAKPTLGNVAVT